MAVRARSGALFIGLLVSGCQLLGPGASTPSTSARAGAARSCPESATDQLSLVAAPRRLRDAVHVGMDGDLLVARYRRAGCKAQLEVLPNCKVRGRYAWRVRTRSRQAVLRTRGAVGEAVPLAFEALEPKRSTAGALRIDERIAGRWVAPEGVAFDRGRLEGPDCAEATHVLTQVEIGGYAVSSGPAAGLEAFDGFGTSRPAAPVQILATSGRSSACSELSRRRQTTVGCDQPVRVRMAPVLDERPARSRGEMVRIAAGPFVMGSGAGRADERPQHRVELSSFEIDRTEVTVAQYTRCVAEKKCRPAGQGRACNYRALDRDEHPVNCVRQVDASAYCTWAGKRLPTEAEWERAARGADGQSFPWGEAWPPPAGAGNLADDTAASSNPNWARVPDFSDGFPGTSPVATFRGAALGEGVLDAVGNVAEWVADIYDAKAYRAKRRVDPKGPRRGAARVVRGSSFGQSRPEDVRLSARFFFLPDTRSRHIGFRCARDVEP